MTFFKVLFLLYCSRNSNNTGFNKSSRVVNTWCWAAASRKHDVYHVVVMRRRLLSLPVCFLYLRVFFCKLRTGGRDIWDGCHEATGACSHLGYLQRWWFNSSTLVSTESNESPVQLCPLSRHFSTPWLNCSRRGKYYQSSKQTVNIDQPPPP